MPNISFHPSSQGLFPENDDFLKLLTCSHKPAGIVRFPPSREGFTAFGIDEHLKDGANSRYISFE